ncbi:MAG: hypothetical protein ACPGVU_05780 [Limisphaerales bacterium]
MTGLIHRLLLIVGMFLLTEASVQAQAFCSLRDPNSYVRQFFPESTTYKSVVRKVSREMAHRLTADKGVEFDPREFGNHTLYVVYQDKTVVGFLQAHSEVVDWGLAEVVWATDNEGKLKRFAFQRCRSPQRRSVDVDKVQDVFKGLSETDLRTKLSHYGVEGFVKDAGLSPKANKLMHGVVNGALKMQVLLREIWGDEFAAAKSLKP